MTHFDYRITKESNTKSVMKFTKNDSSNWKNHVLQMLCSRIPFQILCYQSERRSLGRPSKCWHETI